MNESVSNAATDQDLMELLKKYDTPTITNVVATYPGDKENCLGLYHPWQSQWYTDQRLKCNYPELGRTIGHVVTCVYGLPDPGYKRLTFLDLFKAIEATPKPVVLVVKQNYPENIKNKNGLVGGNMMTAFKQLGVVGVITDGPSRDVDEVRPMGVQYMTTGLCAGHGEIMLEAINVPVEVCGMAVCPGEIVHMDENGALKFPRYCLNDIVEKAENLMKKETAMQSAMRQTTDPLKLARIMSGIID